MGNIPYLNFSLENHFKIFELKKKKEQHSASCGLIRTPGVKSFEDNERLEGTVPRSLSMLGVEGEWNIIGLI